MTIFLVLFFVILAPMTSFAKGVSAHRYPNEDIRFAQARSTGWSFYRSLQQHAENSIQKRSVQEFAVPLEKLDVQTIPELPDKDALEKTFNYIRDIRFLKLNPAFLRRITWLYPDDGCYTRAEMAKVKLIESKYILPKKIFVFGNLTAASKNSSSGTVSWWYHVAIGYNVAKTTYIFDPALEPRRPMTLQEWNLAVGGNQTSVKYAICSADSYDPNSSCRSPKSIDPSEATSDINEFLDLEWERLENLHRDPNSELGEHPPWMS